MGVVRLLIVSTGSLDVSTSMDTFVSEHGQRLVDFAYLVTRDRDVAEDAVHAVLARMAAMEFASISNPVAYARRGIVNETRSRHRRERKFLTIVPELAVDDVDKGRVDVEDRLVLWAAFDTLTKRQRIAVVLRYYEDLPDSEIALILGCAPATVRSLISRALRALRPLVEETDTDE